MHSRIPLMLLLVVALGLISSKPSSAQTPCWDAESKPNAEYPEIDSKCVRPEYKTDRAEFTAEVPGPGMRPGDGVPTCNGVTSNTATVTCRTLCGDLPAGKKVGAMGPQAIYPDGWSMFEQHLQTFQRGDHWRTCLRLRNWAFGSLLGAGTPKHFMFAILYDTSTSSATAASTSLRTPSSQSHTVVKGDSLSKIAKECHSKKWRPIYLANKDKIKDPNKIYPGEVLSVPECR